MPIEDKKKKKKCLLWCSLIITLEKLTNGFEKMKPIENKGSKKH